MITCRFTWVYSRLRNSGGAFFFFSLVTLVNPCSAGGGVRRGSRVALAGRIWGGGGSGGGFLAFALGVIVLCFVGIGGPSVVSGRVVEDGSEQLVRLLQFWSESWDLVCHSCSGAVYDSFCHFFYDSYESCFVVFLFLGRLRGGVTGGEAEDVV